MALLSRIYGNDHVELSKKLTAVVKASPPLSTIFRPMSYLRIYVADQYNIYHVQKNIICKCKI